MKLTRLAMIGAAGAAFAYFFDPDQGRRRRHLAQDRANSFIRRGRKAAAVAAEMAADRGLAMPAEAISAVRPREYDDATLSEKVYTYLNADPKYNGRVNVSAQNGVVVLIGEVEEPEKVVKRVRKVKGVDRIENLLHEPGTPAPHLS